MSVRKKMMTCAAVCFIALSVNFVYPMEAIFQQLEEVLEHENLNEKMLKNFLKQHEALLPVSCVQTVVPCELRRSMVKQDDQLNKKKMKASFQAQRKWRRGGKRPNRSFDKRNLRCGLRGGRRK